MRRAWAVAACVACGAGETGESGVAAMRAGDGFFDRPWPSDARRDPDGRPDLAGFPEADGLLGGVVGGWVRRVPAVTGDFGANAPFAFRFDGVPALPEAPTVFEGSPFDAVLLVDLATGARFPVEVRFIEDDLGDPFLADNLLLGVPALGGTPPSGATVAAVVMASAGVTPGPVDEAVRRALLLGGVFERPAVATVYTVQDSAAQLRAFGGAYRDWAVAEGFEDAALRRVEAVAFAQGETPGGRGATVFTATFAGDAPPSLTYLTRGEPADDRAVDLGEGWPMAVFEGTVRVPYPQGLADRPFMSPGVGHLADIATTSGWLPEDPSAVATADVDAVRVVLSWPKDADGALLPAADVVVWDHGTSGQAYNHVARKSAEDDLRALMEAAAAAGVAILGHDQPLYGQRYPLMEEGFTDGSLGFYNVANLPAFRDNQRQGGLEGEVLHVFATEAIPILLGVEVGRIHRLGHSLGTATAHNGLVAGGAHWASAFQSGPGAHFALSFLETGLGEDDGLVGTLSTLFGVDPADADGIGQLIGLGLGMTAEAAARVDRLHPVVGLFSWIVDPSDPATFAGDVGVPTTLLMGVGDLQIPNRGTEGLAGAIPGASLVRCETEPGYDPHYCLYRDDDGRAAFRAWLEGARAAR